MSRMWRYTLAVIPIWIFTPELRRLYDWRHGYSDISPIAAIPLLVIIPHVLSLTLGGGWRRLSSPVLMAAWLWISGFSYALVLGIINQGGASALYAFANFVLPLAVGLWIAADSSTFQTAIARVARVLFTSATIVSAYGLYQFARLPPWDAYWLRSVARESKSFGLPFPYLVRVFGVLNSPAHLGGFLALTVLASLPFLTIRRPLVLLQVPLWLVTLGLSKDRTGWLMLVGGLLVYIAVAPRRQTVIAALGAIALFLVAGVGIVTYATGSTRVVDAIGERFDTVPNVSTDVSLIDRERLYEEGFNDWWVAPMGQGLGIYGVGTKLSNTARTTDLDSGILGRLTEMGVPGALALVASFVWIGATLLLLLHQAAKKGDVRMCRMMASALACEVSILALEVSMDATGIMFLYFWLFIGLALRADAVPKARAISRFSPARAI